MDENSAIFTIAQAAGLSNMHPQTLRQYDRLGLVSPQRTAGKSRRYSLRNIAQLQEIAKLSSEGVSLAAIQRILDLENQNSILKNRVRELESALSDELIKKNQNRVFATAMSGDSTIIKPGTRLNKRSELVIWEPTVEPTD